MQCVELVAARTNSIPIQECGGVVLADGDKLVVRQEIADRMLLQYNGYLVKVGTVDKENLRGGHYEYVYKGNKPQDMQEVHSSMQETTPCPVVASAADKSFIGKAKRKIKGF
jgi:hypothetical protein